MGLKAFTFRERTKHLKIKHMGRKRFSWGVEKQRNKNNRKKEVNIVSKEIAKKKYKLKLNGGKMLLR